MYKTIKDVIESGRYELSDMMRKIDTIWLQGDVTDDQKTELVTLAQERADPAQSVDILRKLEELDRRMTEMENKDKEPVDEYPEYVPGKWYYKDDKITYKEERCICTAPEGVVCTWNPDEYPAYWQKVE